MNGDNIHVAHIQAHINAIRARLEGSEFDTQNAVPKTDWATLDKIHFLKVTDLAASRRNLPPNSRSQGSVNFLYGAYAIGLPVYFLVVSDGNSTEFYFGGGSEEGVRSLLLGSFPGIRTAPPATPNLGTMLNRGGYLARTGFMTGIPAIPAASAVRQPDTTPAEAASMQIPPIERVIRGMRRRKWALLTIAERIDREELLGLRTHLHNDANITSRQARTQLSEGNTITLANNFNTNQTNTDTRSTEVTNHAAETCLKLIMLELERLDEAMTAGSWNTEVCFMSDTAESYAMLKSLVSAAFGGPESKPTPVRTIDTATHGANRITNKKFRLTSRECGRLLMLPETEVPGIRITDHADFDTTPHTIPENIADIDIGSIMHESAPSTTKYRLALPSLAKHALVVGSTGSGKSSTVASILKQASTGASATQFLVIESAKSEYRSMREWFANRGRKLQVFTAGDERISPIRINPFEFDCIDADNQTHIQTHIDYLKSVFSAAFVLYPPMPYVLETCLYEIYKDRGWDLTSSRNTRLPASEYGNLRNWPIFPTLTDLYEKVHEVTKRLGYGKEIEMNVVAGLETRINSLRFGGKGCMLDVEHGISMADLLNSRSVIELERIGNDDEKTFIIGMLLSRVFAYRRLQGASDKLRHILVIEEAHRLLRTDHGPSRTDDPQTRAQSVEMFANALSEVRAYGQSIVIVDQTPTKLMPDAIKNTTLKIIHRLSARDDQQAMADATNMDDAQRRRMASLMTRQAIVFGEADDHPMLVETKSVQLPSRPTDTEIRTTAALMQTRHTSPQFSEPPSIALSWRSFTYAASRNRANAIDSARRIYEQLIPLLPGAMPMMRVSTAREYMKTTFGEWLQRIGRWYQWSYPHIAELQKRAEVLLQAVFVDNKAQAQTALSAYAQAYVAQLPKLHHPNQIHVILAVPELFVAAQDGEVVSRFMEDPDDFRFVEETALELINNMSATAQEIQEATAAAHCYLIDAAARAYRLGPLKRRELADALTLSTTP